MADPDSPGGSLPSAELTVIASDEQEEFEVDTDRWARLAADVLRSEARRVN